MKSKRWSVGMILAGMALIGSMAVAEPVFPVKRGTNISHWLSQSSRRGAERAQFFTEKDVQFLAGVGFDHLRIPIDEEQMWDEAGAMEPEAFALLNSALDWCETHGLRAIVDLHILRSHHFNDEKRPLWTESAAQERFFQCWRDLSSQLSKRSVDRVAYELMNEPVADDPNDWNRLVAKAVGEIRKLEPKRVLVIGSNRWQSTDTFDQLRVPAGDPNIMLSFHMYEPFALTHHQASWTGIRDYKGPVQYPGITVRAEDLEGLPEAVVRAMRSHVRHVDKAWIAQRLEKPLQVAKSLGLQLYCGEWGCYNMAPEADRLRWYRDVRALFEEHGIGWTTWDYKGGFAVVDGQGRPYQALIDTLLD